MKCPRCDTQNENRTICIKCGMFLYDGRTHNRVKMTPEEIKRQDIKKVFRFSAKMMRVLWMAIVIIVLSFLMLAVIQTFGSS